MWAFYHVFKGGGCRFISGSPIRVASRTRYIYLRTWRYRYAILTFNVSGPHSDALFWVLFPPIPASLSFFFLFRQGEFGFDSPFAFSYYRFFPSTSIASNHSESPDGTRLSNPIFNQNSYGRTFSARQWPSLKMKLQTPLYRD